MTKLSLSHLQDRLNSALPADGDLRPIERFDFPLAFNQPMPEGFGAENGHIGIRFANFVLRGLRSAELSEEDRAAGTRTVTWARLRLDGRYALTGKASPVITLDHGGSMMDFEDPLPAGSDPMAPMDPERKAAMLAQARKEEEKLRNTKNGQKLLRQYRDHNEIYNTVFATSAACRNAWVGDGATREMAEHTHLALDDSDATTSIVNPVPEQQTFGASGTSYNQNAFTQQLQIVVNTINKDPDFNPWDPKAKLNPDSKFVKASLAALDFGKATEDTGNTKSDTSPMTGEEIHGSVDVGKPPPPSSVDELENVMAQGVGRGGAAAAARANNWRVLDEEDRRLVRRHIYLHAVEEAETADIQPVPLWEGACFAELSGVAARLDFDASDRLQRVAIHLPAFEFDIDDSAWTGPAADVARDRLAEVGFARSFILERLQTSLETALRDALCA